MKIIAKALIWDKAGNILLLRRSLTHPNFPRHFDFPGGEVEPNEEYINAVRREIQEETGLDVSLDDLELVYEKQIADGLVHIIYNANTALHAPPVILSWEHSGYEWIPFDELTAIALPEGADEYHLTVLGYLGRTKTLVS